MTPLLHVDHATFSYPESAHPTFADVSFDLDEGCVMCIIGPNGAGKSTLLNTIVGMLSLASGTISIEGEDVSRLSRSRIARTVAYVTQSKAPGFDYRVLDYVVTGRAAHLGVCKAPSESDYELALRGLERMGVERLAERSYLKLSGGERQQVDIARALVQDPRLVILDEPTSALDFGNQAKVIRVVEQLAHDGYAVLMTTHNPNHAIMLDGLVGILDSSGTMTVGSAAETITEAQLSRAYSTDVVIDYVAKAHRDVCTIA